MEPASLLRTDVLVVIPCLNEQSHIGSVLSGIFGDPARDRFTVVVADGGSTDATCRIVAEIAARNQRLRLIANPARIQSAGINRAVRLFGDGHRWLVRMDAHAKYPDNYISMLVSEAARTRASSVVVAMKARGIGYFQRAAAAAQNSLLGAGGSPHRSCGTEGYVDHGHHGLIDLKLFRLLDGYDGTQAYNEDAEFDVRLTRAGGAIWLTRATEVTYFPRARVGDLFWQYRNHGRGRATTILRHRMRPKIRQLIPAFISPGVLIAALAPLHLFFALPVAIWLASCAAFGIFLGAKERSTCALAAGCVAPVMHFAWSIGFWSVLIGWLASAGTSQRKLTAATVR